MRLIMGNPRHSLRILSWEQLTKAEAYQLFCLRTDVFVVGQKITDEPELDGLDPQCYHVFMADKDGNCVGTARLFMAESPIKVGRIAVARRLQRGGLGTELMLGLQEFIGDRPAMMHAQAHLEPWYSSLGWERVGRPFMEAGIEHVEMRFPGIRVDILP